MTKGEPDSIINLKYEIRKNNSRKEEKMAKTDVRPLIECYKSDPTIADTLPETYRRLLHLHYLECISWRRVAVIMDYSEDNIYKLRSKALDKLREVSHNV